MKLFLKNISKHNFLVMLAFLFSLDASCQKENANWYFGFNSGLHFDGVNVTPITGSLTSLENCASISDSNGNILLYTDGGRVYNSIGNTIADTLGTEWLNYNWNGGTDGYYGSSTTNGSIFLPGFNDSTFFLFSINDLGIYGCPKGLIMNKFIVTSNIQQLIYPHNQLINSAVSPLYTEKITAIRHANGRDWWIIIFGGSQLNFQKFLFTPNGIEGPFYQTIGSGFHDVVGEIVAAKDGSKLGLASYYSAIDIFDFDRCTGELSNYIELGDPPYNWSNEYKYYGLCFSPDGLKLYAASGKYCYQFDLNNSNPKQTQTIIYTNSYLNLANGDSALTLGQMELGNDSRIYQTLSRQSYNFPFNNIMGYRAKYLNVINSPNQIAPLCNYQEQELFLNGNYSTLGLPNIVNYNLGKIVGSACDTICIITAQTESQQQTICSGDSVLIYGVYQKLAGVYNDTLHTYNQCDSIYGSTTLTIETINATVTENNKTLTAIPITIGTNYQWYNCDSSINITGATSQTFTPTHTGNYACIVTNNGCTGMSACEEVITSTYDLLLTTYDFHIYPNPTTDEVIIELGHPELFEELIVTDILGRKLLEVKSPSPREGFRMGSFSTGVYILELKMKNGEQIKRKLVKE